MVSLVNANKETDTMTTTKITSNSSKHEILDALLEDDFALRSPADAEPVARAIRHAARVGALVWTPAHVVSTSRPRVATQGRVVYIED